MFAMNWLLTNAQIELLTSDTSVIDYGDMKKKRKKGDYDNTPADSGQVRKAGDEWLSRYGNDADAGKGLSVQDILGGGMSLGVGVKASD